MSLKVDTLSPTTGNTITVTSGNRIVGVDAGTFDAPPRVGGIVQMTTTSTYPIAHITSTSLSENTVPLIASITPRYSTSKIKVEFWSSMMYGAANALCLILYRRIAGGTYSNLTPLTNSSARYAYGWMYNSSSWGSSTITYYDTPATTSLVEYVVNYRNISSTATNYVVHQYMEYGYTLTEIYA